MSKTKKAPKPARKLKPWTQVTLAEFQTALKKHGMSLYVHLGLYTDRGADGFYPVESLPTVAPGVYGVQSKLAYLLQHRAKLTLKSSPKFQFKVHPPLDDMEPTIRKPK